jgi:hypothetical protein
MATTCELAERTSIRAFRCGPNILIVAEGQLPHPGFDVKIDQRPERIFPPFYQVLRCARPGFFPQIVVPYKVSRTVGFPEDVDSVRVFHADGDDDVKIEPCGDELAEYASVVGAGRGDERVAAGSDEATGFSKSLSFDEAFGDALSKLPPVKPVIADQLERVVVEEIGGLFGGFAGFHDLFVRVSRTHD